MSDTWFWVMYALPMLGLLGLVLMHGSQQRAMDEAVAELESEIRDLETEIRDLDRRIEELVAFASTVGADMGKLEHQAESQDRMIRLAKGALDAQLLRIERLEDAPPPDIPEPPDIAAIITAALAPFTPRASGDVGEGADGNPNRTTVTTTWADDVAAPDPFDTYDPTDEEYPMGRAADDYTMPAIPGVEITVPDLGLGL